MKELSNQELMEINGGESGWYWLAYGFSSFIRLIGENPPTASPTTGGPIPH